MKSKFILFLCFSCIVNFSKAQSLDSLYYLYITTSTIESVEKKVREWDFTYKNSENNVTIFGEKYTSAVYFERRSSNLEKSAIIAFYIGDTGVSKMISYMTSSEKIMGNFKKECQNKEGTMLIRDEIEKGAYITKYRRAMHNYIFLVLPAEKNDEFKSHLLFIQFTLRK